MLLDGSYSMSLRPERGGERRIDVALRWAAELLRRAAAEEEWAVLVTGGSEGARIVRPFSVPSSGALGRQPAVVPDGTTPLGAALERAARYLRDEGAGAEKRIVLISDGLATEPEAYLLPNAAWFRERAVTVTAVLYRVAALAERQRELEEFAAGTGGRLFDAQGGAVGSAAAELLASIRLPDRGRAVERAQVRGVTYRERPARSVTPARRAVQASAATGLPGRAAARVSARGDSPSAVMAGTAVAAATRRAPLSFRPVWLALPLVGLSAWRLARRLLAVARFLTTPRLSIAWRRILRLDLRGPGGSRSVVLRTLPARIGGSGAADLRLEPSRGAPALADFEIRPTREGAEFASPSPLNVNGVSRTYKLLRDGDSVAYGAHRIVFRDVSSERVVTRRPPVAFGLPWELGLLAACLLAVLLFREQLSTPVDPGAALLAGRTGAAVARAGLAAGAEAAAGGAGEAGGPRRLSASARPSAGARSGSRGLLSVLPPAVQDAASPAAPAEPLFAPRAAPPRPAAVTVWAPGESIAWSKADALLVHAHPDDESIDFGVLASRLSAAGKHVVVALMTDGEAGLDQYPDRESGGLYARRDLWPEELAVVRPLEARRAIAELGASTYVRLGLRNHPYTTSRQVLPLGTVMAAWGGEESVVGRLVELIEGFRPDLVASPDSAHGGAHEHFEHAAAGYAVREALRRVRARGVHAVSVHARSVDWRFRDAYDDVQALDALERIAPSGESFRERQTRALREHRTQRDATVVALESLTSGRWEYYVTTFWSEPTTLDRFLRTW